MTRLQGKGDEASDTEYIFSRWHMKIILLSTYGGFGMRTWGLIYDPRLNRPQITLVTDVG
jgi:hypothetical protein